jgi:hypothetical protein
MSVTAVILVTIDQSAEVIFKALLMLGKGLGGIGLKTTMALEVHKTKKRLSCSLTLT